MSRTDNSKVPKSTRGYVEPSRGRDTDQFVASRRQSAPGSKLTELGRERSATPRGSERSRYGRTLRSNPNGWMEAAKGNRNGRNSAVLAHGNVRRSQAIGGQPATSNKGNSSWWFETDEKHIFFRSTPFTANVPIFRHNPIRLLKSDLVNAVNTPQHKPFDSSCDSLGWTALQWATTEGAGDLFSDPTDSSENAREHLADRSSDWLGELGYSNHSLGALVSDGDFIRNYRQQAHEKPPDPVHDWTHVYRTLSRQDKQGWSHDTFKAQKSEAASEVMSLMSFAESIFDAATTMSTASSVPGDTQELISKFVNLLVRDPSIARMLPIALSDIGIGHERFRRNFSRILRSYSRELRRSLDKDKPDNNDPSYGRAIAFVSHKAPHAAHLVVSRFGQARTSARPRYGLPESDGDISSASEDGEDENEILNMEKLESFFTTSEPFRLLRWKLRALIIPDSFLSRVRVSTEQLIRIASGCGLTDLLSRAQQQKGGSLGDLWTNLTKQLEHLARDLRAQCNTLGQIRVADFLSVYSEYVAARFEESLATEREPSSQDDHPSDGILQDIVANTLPEVWEVDFPAHWGFLASTKAFQEFFSDLRDLAYPTLFSRAEKLIAKRNEPEGQRLLPILSELRWAVGGTPGGKGDISTFNIIPQDKRLTDRCKLAVEATTGAEWDWWPFCPPPRHRAYNSPDGELLSWKCVSLLDELPVLPYYNILLLVRLCHNRQISMTLLLQLRHLPRFLQNYSFHSQVPLNGCWSCDERRIISLYLKGA